MTRTTVRFAQLKDHIEFECKKCLARKKLDEKDARPRYRREAGKRTNWLKDNSGTRPEHKTWA